MRYKKTAAVWQATHWFVTCRDDLVLKTFFSAWIQSCLQFVANTCRRREFIQSHLLTITNRHRGKSLSRICFRNWWRRATLDMVLRYWMHDALRPAIQMWYEIVRLSPKHELRRVNGMVHLYDKRSGARVEGDSPFLDEWSGEGGLWNSLQKKWDSSPYSYEQSKMRKSLGGSPTRTDVLPTS